MTSFSFPSWISRLSGSAVAERLRLVCFPYAGGGAHIYADWRDVLPSSVGVHAVQLPGRGRRFAEPALDRLDLMVAGIAHALRALDDKPMVFFGHSMGALLAFETARALRRLGQRGPSRLLLSAYRAPQFCRDEPCIHHLPDGEFADKLRELEGTPPEVFENRELLQLMLPMVRADFAAVETYRHRPELPLSCPITAFGGLSDGDFPHESMQGWSAHTRSEFRMHMLEGSHFFIHSARDELLQLVSAEVERELAACAQRYGAVA